MPAVIVVAAEDSESHITALGNGEKKWNYVNVVPGISVPKFIVLKDIIFANPSNYHTDVNVAIAFGSVYCSVMLTKGMYSEWEPLPLVALTTIGDRLCYTPLLEDIYGGVYQQELNRPFEFKVLITRRDRGPVGEWNATFVML